MMNTNIPNEPMYFKRLLQCFLWNEEQVKSMNASFYSKVGIFDVKRDDPLMLSNIVGETIVSCWSMEKIAEANGK